MDKQAGNFIMQKTFGKHGCFPKLTIKERMTCFLSCVIAGSFYQSNNILGYVITILSTLSIFGLATGKPQTFAILYSLGNVLSIAATGFLMGFRR